jgi:hypothetical protein
MLVRLIQRATGWAIGSGAALLVLSLSVTSAYGQKCCQPYIPYPCPTPQAPSTQPQQPEVPPQPQAPAAQEPAFSPEAFGATGGGETFAAATPGVIGDGGIRGTTQAAIRANSFKISENESPRPTNRIYFDYNYFNNVQGTGNNVNRMMPGFEQTFFGGAASFGMRLPTYVTSHDQALGVQGIGNLNLIGKYAFYDNRTTGNLLSGGMLLSLPTGRAININGADVHDTVLLPYGAFIYNPASRLYVQGFSSIAVPTDARDITIWFNDISTGFWAYRTNQDQFLTAIIPTIEGHVNTPLNHRGLGDTFGLQDSFVLTVGSHFIVRQRAIMTLGVADPLTGPKPFGVEAIAQFNWRY